MKIKVLLFAISFSALFGATSAIAAEQYIYKWKDPEGMVHYTERPPAPGIAFEKVRREKERGTSTSAPTTSKASSDSIDTAADDSYSSWRNENCKIAIQNLDVLQNAARISQDDGQGGKRLMTDEEKAEKIQQMTAQKDKYCTEESDDN